MPATGQGQLLAPQSHGPPIPTLVLHGRDELNLPHLATGNLVSQISVHRLKVTLVGDHEDLPRVLRMSDHLVSMFDSADHRLFRQYVQATVQGVGDLFEMERVGCRNLHSVQLDIGQQILVVVKGGNVSRQAVVAGSSTVKTVCARVAQCHDLCVLHFVNSADVARGVAATADKSNANAIHFLRSFSCEVAAAIYRRSSLPTTHLRIMNDK